MDRDIPSHIFACQRVGQAVILIFNFRFCLFSIFKYNRRWEEKLIENTVFKTKDFIGTNIGKTTDKVCPGVKCQFMPYF